MRKANVAVVMVATVRKDGVASLAYVPGIHVLGLMQ
jgi:hypothetical protein